MKKSDLKYGNVIETRNGNKYLYYITTSNQLLNLKDNFNISLDYYNENLLHISNCGLLDIMKVYKDYTCKELIWERKEEPKLTEDEKAILRNVPQYYKWIARDGNGVVCLYPDKPHKSKTIWDSYGALFPFHHLFQFIKWEDEEPYSIKELLGEDK